MLPNRNKLVNGKRTQIVRVAILWEELLGWGSGKEYFPAILDGYKWKCGDVIYEISTSKIFDKDIINGLLTTSRFHVLLAPGGGVGDVEAIVKGFNLRKKTQKWKKNISDFIKDGGGYVGICGGSALITGLTTGNKRKTRTFLERLYDKSAIGVSCVTSYYNNLAFPLFYPFQNKYPEQIGATAYVFSYAPGETVDGAKIFANGVPIDFKISKDNPIFSDFPMDTERIRWWGGPALIVPKKPDREVKVLARYPEKELSEDETTKIFAWKYSGGIHGLIFSVFKGLKFIKANKGSLRNLPLYSYFFAGDWKPSNKLIELNFSNKASMTAEIYPNKNNGRIILCTGHPQYMIWWGGKIEEVNNTGFKCIATGFHQWKQIAPLSKEAIDEFTHSWWIVRRMVAWAAKIPDKDMPPIIKGQLTEKSKKFLSSKVYWDGTILHQISNV